MESNDSNDSNSNERTKTTAHTFNQILGSTVKLERFELRRNFSGDRVVSPLLVEDSKRDPISILDVT